MSGEIIELLTQNWSAQLKLAVSNSLSADDRAAVLALAPGALPQLPEHSTKINVEELPLVTVEQIQVGVLVWVFRVIDKEWLAGVVVDVETTIWDDLLKTWIVKTNCGRNIKARSLEKLRLRQSIV